MSHIDFTHYTPPTILDIVRERQALQEQLDRAQEEVTKKKRFTSWLSCVLLAMGGSIIAGALWFGDKSFLAPATMSLQLGLVMCLESYLAHELDIDGLKVIGVITTFSYLLTTSSPIHGTFSHYFTNDGKALLATFLFWVLHYLPAAFFSIL